MQHITSYWLQQLISALVPATDELVMARHRESAQHALLRDHPNDIIAITLGIGREPTRMSTVILEPEAGVRPWTLLLPSSENELGAEEAPSEYPSEVRSRGSAEVVAGLACGHAVATERSPSDLNRAAWRWLAHREEQSAKITQAILDIARTDRDDPYEW